MGFQSLFVSFIAFSLTQATAHAVIGVADLEPIAGAAAPCAQALKLDFDVTPSDPEGSFVATSAVADEAATEGFVAGGGSSQIALSSAELTASRGASQLNWNRNSGRVDVLANGQACVYHVQSLTLLGQ